MNRKERRTGKVIILSGPSGAGKTTLHDLLLKSETFKDRIVRSISATTRKPRGGEKHGREYLFLSPKLFEHKIRRGQFLEHAKVFDNYYGTPTKSVRDVLRSGKNVLLCIDVQGAKLVKEKVPGAVTVFVRTPTIDDLRKRLTGRGTDAPEVVELRLKTARQEMEEAKHYDHVIVNDQLDRASKELFTFLAKALGI